MQVNHLLGEFRITEFKMLYYNELCTISLSIKRLEMDEELNKLAFSLRSTFLLLSNHNKYSGEGTKKPKMELFFGKVKLFFLRCK
jgi:hypothetical protein